MKYTSIVTIILLNFVYIYNIFAQKNIRLPNTKFIFCPAPPAPPVSQRSHPVYISPPKEFLNRYNNPNLKTENKSTINVNYVGFSPEAQAAFQYAVDIWESILISPVEINVLAEWEDLGSTILGSAGPANYYRLLTEATVSKNHFYVDAIAEKIRGTSLNENNPDIFCVFNSSYPRWYFGTDGFVVDKQDFVSVVLHELGHGLGFFAVQYVDYNRNRGTLRDRFRNPGNNFSSVYASLLVDETGSMLYDESLFPDPSVELGSHLVGNNLFFNSPIVKKVNSGENAKISAPANFDNASSISHLDENLYPFGDINALMTPSVQLGEVIHDPGPIMLAMFAEIGWVHLNIEHQNLPFIKDTISELTITAKITADSVIDENSILVYYSNDKFVSDENSIKMLPTSNNDEYEADIPAPGGHRGDTVYYYISAGDNLPKTYTLPGDAPEVLYKTFEWQDRENPEIFHGQDRRDTEIFYNYPSYILSTKLRKDGIPIIAEVRDNFGVEEVYVEFSINDVEQDSIPLDRVRNTNLYEALLPFDQVSILRNDDVIKYRIVAKDVSKYENKTFEPSSGRNEIVVRDLFSPQISYSNNLNNQTADFTFGDDHFNIATPGNFNDGAIHSSHPYSSTDNYTFLLLKPIILGDNSTTSPGRMSFDEIVLVEPGENNSVFGDFGFWDYVIVEASKDKGITWVALEDGYDSRRYDGWLKAYNKNIDLFNNSTIEGRHEMFKNHQINILENSYFNAGDTVVIRFRLWANDLIVAWGWAIDNLEIQTDKVTSMEDFLSKQEDFKIYPNPSRGKTKIELSLKRFVDNLQLQVLNIYGQQLYKREYTKINQLYETFDVSTFPQGIYYMILNLEGHTLNRKLMIVK